jgi:hypothetical protein
MDGSALDLATNIGMMNRSNSNDGFGFGGGSGAIWILIILFFIMFAGGGFGGYGANSAAVNGALTRNDLSQDMNFQSLENSVRGIQSGLCDGFYAQNTTMLNGLSSMQRDLCTGFAGINSAVNNLGYQMQNCCCETNRNIDAVRYDNSKNTCDIINASNAGVQRILDKMCETEVNTLRTQLQSAQLALNNNAQTQTLINQLRPTPVPAYITCSPYTAFNGVGLSGYGCGYSCNS